MSIISQIKWTGREDGTNCQAENKDLYKALIDYWNSEVQGQGKLLEQPFLGPRLKTNLPATADLLRPVENNQHDKLQARYMKYKEFHDRRGTRNLPDLHPGDNVMLQDGNTWRHSTVESKLSLPKSFLVLWWKTVYAESKYAEID